MADLLWSPQPGPQTALIRCPCPEIGFGGARGGGKTDGVLGRLGIRALRYRKGYNGAIFRREMPQQDDLIERAKELYCGAGGAWYEQRKLIVMPGGGRIRFRPLENIQDAEKYQGQNLTDAAVEEAGNYPDPAPIDRLQACLRSKEGYPTSLLLSFNPGGPGHSWLKQRFWNPAPQGMVPIDVPLPGGLRHTRIFIPSRIQNNRILLARDPGYIARLHLVGSPELVRAWLEGDFEIHEGAYFPEFGGRHIVEPFPIPRHWNKVLGFDWGYHSPFCAVWGAISSGKDDKGKEVPYRKGSIVIYRELSARQWENIAIARAIRDLSADDGDLQMVADPSIFAHEGGPSIADTFRAENVAFKPADNERIAGATQVRMRLKHEPAMLYFFRTCKYLIESLPALPIDPKHPEDCDSEADDHGYDALRYLCMSRLLESIFQVPEDEDRMGKVTISRYVERKKALRQQTRL